MEELEAQLQETAAKLDPANLTGEDLERYVKSRSGLVRNPAHLRIRHPPGDGQRHCQ